MAVRIDTRRGGVTGTAHARAGNPRLRLIVRRSARLLTAACLVASLGGCHVFSIWNPDHVRRGALIDPEALKDLVPGTSTRADVTSVLGTPTAHATFDDNTWIYVTQITSTRIGRTPGVTMQKVLVLQFDPKGTLTNIRDLDKADGKQIAMAPGATPSPGSEASFMQQLLGNVGKFTPAGLPSSSSGSALGPSGGNTLP
ncbi:MAG TPA: outer membrane protein assembly factor BamE [Acetobacteraceae bacterium]|nr:outer membrane protein assembly factor BamE [Acetobacteraceae bacterium]